MGLDIFGDGGVDGGGVMAAENGHILLVPRAPAFADFVAFHADSEGVGGGEAHFQLVAVFGIKAAHEAIVVVVDFDQRALRSVAFEEEFALARGDEHAVDVVVAGINHAQVHGAVALHGAVDLEFSGAGAGAEQHAAEEQKSVQ